MADLNKLRQVNPHWKPSEDHLNKVHKKLWGEKYEGIANIHTDKYDGDINKEKEIAHLFLDWQFVAAFEERHNFDR